MGLRSRARRRAALLVAATCCGAAHAAPIDGARVAELLQAAAELSGRASQDGPPPLRALPMPALVLAVCPAAPEDCRGIVAAYDARLGIVFHRDSLDMAQAFDRSFVVHELVHYLQHQAAGAGFLEAGCVAAVQSEREAYRVQNRYLREHGQRRRVGQALAFTLCEDADPRNAARYDAQRGDIVVPER